MKTITRDLVVLDKEQTLFETDTGYIIYKICDVNYCDINLIEIDNAEKNKGQGQVLLKTFLDDMKLKGIIGFALDDYIVNNGIYSLDVLKSFYKKFGFKEIGRMEEEGKERIFMSLTVEENSKVKLAS